MDNLLGKVLGGAAGVIAKGTEQALIQLDRHGTDGHAKIGDERRAEKIQKIKETSDEIEKIEEGLEQLTLRLERLFIDFNYAKTVGEREKARVSMMSVEKEIEKIEERIIKNSEKVNGKPILKALKDFFTKSDFSERVKITRRSFSQRDRLKELRGRFEEL